MPIYEFQCEDCGEVFEEFVFRKDEKIVCKKCKSENVKKLISKVAFKCEGRFTGSGSGKCSGCSGGSCSSCH